MGADQTKIYHAGWRAIARRFLLLFVPLFVLVGIIVAAIYGVQFRAAHVVLKLEQKNHVAQKSEMVVSDFPQIVSDLLILSKSRTLQSLLAGEADAGEALARDLVVFTKYKRIYDQARYLDETGREVIRINFRHGQPVIVPEQQLQTKAGRYYFPETIRVQRGEVFVSPFDLNVEEGKVQQPIKPTIRFATPVFDPQGNRRGMLILNYLGSNLLDRFSRRNENAAGQIMLLNTESHWLHTANPADRWGFMSPKRSDRTFRRRYPHVWQRILRQNSGQFETPEGLFTFQTVYPVMSLPNTRVPARHNYYWKVVTLVPPLRLAAETRQLWFGFVQVLLLMMVVLAGGSALAAKVIADHDAARAALNQAQRLAAIGEAMTGLAHESRNALQRSQACLEMLGKRVRDRPDVAELIERLQNAQQDLHRLYETVREYAAPIVLHRQRFDLREIVDRTWAQLEVIQQDSAAILTHHGGPVDTRVSVDPFAMEQALRNVLDNALRNEQAEPLRVDVTWSLTHLNGTAAVQVVIADNGPGLSPGQAKHIFDPFYTTRTRGTGLGMTITRRIIEAHDGNITVGHHNNPGAVIVIVIPRSQS